MPYYVTMELLEKLPEEAKKMIEDMGITQDQLDKMSAAEKSKVLYGKVEGEYSDDGQGMLGQGGVENAVDDLADGDKKDPGEEPDIKAPTEANLPEGVEESDKERLPEELKAMSPAKTGKQRVKFGDDGEYSMEVDNNGEKIEYPDKKKNEIKDFNTAGNMSMAFIKAKDRLNFLKKKKK